MGLEAPAGEAEVEGGGFRARKKDGTKSIFSSRGLSSTAVVAMGDKEEKEASVLAGVEVELVEKMHSPKGALNPAGQED